MNKHEKAFQQAQQRASETTALTEQVQIQLSDTEFEHFQQLVNTPSKVSDRLKQAAQQLDQDGF